MIKFFRYELVKEGPEWQLRYYFPKLGKVRLKPHSLVMYFRAKTLWGVIKQRLQWTRP